MLNKLSAYESSTKGEESVGGIISIESLSLPHLLLYLKWYNYNQELGIRSALLELNGNAIAKETSAGVLGCLM